MKLKEYLSASGKTHAEFAKEIEVSPQSLYRYINGERIPDREVMPRITKATENQVTADSFYQ
jgi:transcriptional regulator with XRE-family HTH domain